ncbi:MAG: D-isomer specific 2-hydroxyacid dehydrogenase NAD-binding protein [Solirubrobacterales bacterium]|nr:D-isomer specific 2-hydroxyacid dehydrogenase NAD-binding protein [Solirubrobacterales bacterium]
MRVAVLDDYQGVAASFAPWEALGEDVEVRFFREHVSDDDVLAALLAPYEVVVAMRERTPFTAERLARLPSLRLLVTTGMRNAAIDMDAARELGIVVCGTGMLGGATSELTWGLIIALTRHVCAEDARMRVGGWQATVGPELRGRTLGILGLGRLGRRVAAVAQAFEMRVVAWSENLRAADAATVGVEAVARDDLFARADVLTIHTQLSERTRSLVGARELGLMKRSAVLVNTSRGPIVDESALLDALRSGTIAGAALDVYDIEPLPLDHPLRTAPNTVLTPHIGYVTTGTYEVFYREAVEDIAAFLRGEPVRVLGA